MATLYIIQGFLGAGKTTFSKKFSIENDAVHLNADELCMKDFSAEQRKADWNACFASAVEKIWARTEAFVRDKKDVVLDLGFWDRASRDDARTRARAMGADVRHYYIYAPDDVLQARIAQRGGTIAQKNIENFTNLKTQFTPPMPDEHAIVIETASEPQKSLRPEF